MPLRRLYSNKLAGRYGDEAAAADAVNMTGVPAGSPEFDLLVIQEARLIYVVTEQDELIVGPDVGWPLSHAVLAENRTVFAAGEVSLAVAGDVRMAVDLNNKSGHYEPDPDCLDEAVRAFEHAGFEVPKSVITRVKMDQ